MVPDRLGGPPLADRPEPLGTFHVCLRLPRYGVYKLSLRLSRCILDDNNHHLSNICSIYTYDYSDLSRFFLTYYDPDPLMGNANMSAFWNMAPSLTY